jgi:bacterioferritin
MGQLGRELGGSQTAAILKALVRAYADEWFAHYNFEFTAGALQGHHSPATVSLLRGKSAEAFSRTRRLASRIKELGGEPIRKLTDLIQHATDKPFKLPESLSDMNGVLRAVLDAERTSIRTYHALYELSRSNDPVTELLVREILGDANHGEEELERLIGDADSASERRTKA